MSRVDQRSPRDGRERYLLGQLSDAEAEELEKRYFADDALFAELEAVETDLLDEYVRGELDSEERAAFEGLLATSPSLKSRVASASSLHRVLDSREAASPSTSRPRNPLPTLAAAAVLLAALGSALAWQTMSARRRLDRLETERGALQSENRRLAGELEGARAGSRAATARGSEEARPVTPGLTGDLVGFVLSEELLRGAGAPNDLRVPPGAKAILLEVPVESRPGQRYRVVIEDPSGGAVLEQRGLTAVRRKPGTFVLVPVSRESLPAGDYVVKLSRQRSPAGFEEVSELAFRVSYR